MRRILLNPQTELRITGIKGYLEKKVTKFGTGAKIDCPKEFLNKKVYLIFVEDEKTPPRTRK